MRADGGEGGADGRRDWAGETCTSCGAQRATEALQRRTHRAPLCYQCWLDILCGLKPMPPARWPLGAPDGASQSPVRSALVVGAAGSTAVEHPRARSREFRELQAAYASAFQAQAQGGEGLAHRIAFFRAARALRDQAAVAQEQRARHRGTPAATWSAAAHSAAFLRLRRAREALEEARARGVPARQEGADFHEALAIFRSHAASVRGRAQRLRSSAGRQEARRGSRDAQGVRRSSDFD